MYPKEVTGAGDEAALSISRNRTLHHQGPIRGLICVTEDNSTLSLNIGHAGTPVAYPFGADNGSRRADILMYFVKPLMQYKPCYSSPFAIFLSVAICRKKSF